MQKNIQDKVQDKAQDKVRSRLSNGFASAGWVLFDVMAALVVMGTLVGSLVGGVATLINREAAVRKAAADLVKADTVNQAAWYWQSVRLDASWSPGHRLEISLLADTSLVTHSIGVWVNGWFVFEQELDDSGHLVIGSNMWAIEDGDEVILRVGIQENMWGPPWRTVVPNQAGRIIVSNPGERQELGINNDSDSIIVGDEYEVAYAADLNELVDDDERHLAGEVVIHSPSATKGEFDFIAPLGESVAPRNQPLPGERGLPFFADGIANGVMGLQFCESVQAWRSENARSLDVFY